jgi:hypothetical protein
MAAMGSELRRQLRKRSSSPCRAESVCPHHVRVGGEFEGLEVSV